MNHCNGPVFWDHYEDVRKMQLSTTVKNESCHPTLLLFVPPNYSLISNHLDQMRYLLSKPPCWTPFSACPRVVTSQLLAWGKKRAPSHLWVGPCGVSLRACHHCHPLRRDQPGGCSNCLILYNIQVKPWCSRPRTIWARWRRSNAKYPWSLSLCLIENVVKKNPNGHSTSSILHSGGDGRGGICGERSPEK